MIRKLLIANRGEIACRVIRTARRMGIATVAVYSDADAKALHVRQADEAVHIGPSPAAESYLVGEKIIAAAKATGADAIHPGYGFLSENAGFARAVGAAGITWVGPHPDSIEAMGLKDAAKKLMRAAGVPVTPGYTPESGGEDQSPERLQKEADSIGYPVLIKAVAGGGGKGMRKVDAPEDFLSALESCKREARSSFANEEVLLEKWITSPRHIEVQVFGDTHGTVVHLFERDCSLQRRHQKVIEEAPAPGMDEETRAAICGAAVRAAEAVNYVGAGTVEFIADASEGLRADRIFFMEMNTRLQVEHPVTEEITGVDLVEWQLRVASGEPIPLQQDELKIDGWAMEARLYAENTEAGFLPSTGTLDHLAFGEDARIETGVEAGSEISPYYDPMIAKVVTHRATREQAIASLDRTLRRTQVWPVRTNKGFLVRLLADDEFRAGTMTTGRIAERGDALLERPQADTGALSRATRALTGIQTGHDQLVRQLFNFRLNRDRAAPVTIDLNGTPHSFVPDFAGRANTPWWQETGDGVLMVVDGDDQIAAIARADHGGAASAHDGDILAPMPGKVISVDVAEGQQVEAGQRLLVLEAMKMEHALTAPFAGTVVELKASEGAQVQVEALLARVEPTED